jgi:transposase
MVVQLHALGEDERTKIDRLTHAQTAPVRLARRAHIIALAAQGLTAPQIAQQLQISEKAVRQWLKRFESAGVAGLEDAPRCGRPPTYRPDETNRVIAKARSLPPKPQIPQQEAPDASEPISCHWTLDRLQAELAKEGIAIKRSQIRRLLKAEHIKWQRPRTWLESDDPEFAEKRGPSSNSTPTHPLAAR